MRVLMKDSQEGLSVLLKKFIDRQAEIQRLFWTSPSFRSLCGDYKECLDAFKHWQESTLGEAPALRREYDALLQDLEQEAVRYLEDEKTPRMGQP